MGLIQLYIDEDAVRKGLMTGLRSRGVTVLTALEAGLSGAPDEQQLAHATAGDCVLYSHNSSDFYRLHTEWLSVGRVHAGMILAPQQRFSIGEQLRRILRIRAAVSAEAMRNRAEFLGTWA
ncbi:MAG TPA: hypothetical protein DEH78_04480 [Solibacterales bacterium]|nr:hypothetical protein [Bryobacterales bacterium]